ncbi:hypothetical protein BGW41_002002 [Actinomortierella wolfii]|nr:hypothetical protein BGW41_002002 [Actinomortierella wolfii]
MSTAPIFTLGDKIGSGAYGSVYYARWAGDPCAAKCFFLTQSDYAQEEIQKEIRILKRLRHRNIIQFYRTHEFEGCTYLIMDFAENGSLANAIQSRMIQDWPTKIRLAHEIARGLEYIHLQQIWHRDLKSANVLLSRHMEAKLCDFGLAETRSVSITRSCLSVKGTLRWMAPELLAAKPKYSAKSDIYALGIMMWEMAAECTKPFKDQDNNSVIAMLIKRGERETLPVETPADYHRWVERCWDPDPAARPEAREVVLIGIDQGKEVDIVETSLEPDGLKYLNAREVRDNIDYRGRGMSISSISSMSAGTQSSVAYSDRLDMIFSRLDLKTDSGTLTSEGYNNPTMDELAYRADRNDVEAQIALASRYESGDGVAKNESEAFYWYLRAAKQGNMLAQYRLGEVYFQGKGTPQSDTEACTWYRRSAEQGCGEAQFQLGWMFANGRGVEKNDTEALLWYQRAADNNNISAQINLGWKYLKGQGVVKSETAGVRWFRKAAEGGDATAQNLLGTLYFKGLGVQRSYEEAFFWFRKAAEKGDAVAQNNLGWMYENGRGVARDNAEAFIWYHKAADQGEALAQNSIGWMYEHGQGVAHDNDVAACWYRKAAEQGNSLAQTNLASMYKSGRGVQRSDTEAIRWYRRAAESGDASAQCSLGSMYLKGRGIEKNDVEAAFWFRKAAEQGDRGAMYRLGSMYYYGRGVDRSDNDAFRYYQMAAERDEPRAQSRLGWMLETGRGVPKNATEALWWYRKAAEQGDATALFSLGRAYEEGLLGLRSNLPQARAYYIKAAQHGHAEAKERLQFMLKEE